MLLLLFVMLWMEAWVVHRGCEGVRTQEECEVR